MQGRVRRIQPKVVDGRLKILTKVRTDDGPEIEAYLPDREVSALLPREILLGEETNPPRALLRTLADILKTSVHGRCVRVWEYQDRHYASFPSWRSVKFRSRR